MLPRILRRWWLAALILALCSVPLVLVAQSTYKPITEISDFRFGLMVGGSKGAPLVLSGTAAAPIIGSSTTTSVSIVTDGGTVTVDGNLASGFVQP